VAHLGEQPDRSSPDLLRGGLSRHHLGMLALERGQAPDQLVVLGVADLGIVQLEIAAVVIGDEPPQICGLVGGSLGHVDKATQAR